jgi:hypothetical protein
MPQPFLKRTFETVWCYSEETLRATSENRFRSISDVNQYLFRYWQLASGDFIPYAPFNKCKCYDITMQNIENIIKTLLSKKITEICLNDTDETTDSYFEKIQGAFTKKFPQKSSFEL